MRSRRADLSPFRGLEGEHSDFTLTSLDIAHRFTTWLVSRGFEQAQLWLGMDLKYHLEVKTTTGDLTEPFMVSNNQMRLVSLDGVSITVRAHADKYSVGRLTRIRLASM